MPACRPRSGRRAARMRQRQARQQGRCGQRRHEGAAYRQPGPPPGTLLSAALLGARDDGVNRRVQVLDRSLEELGQDILSDHVNPLAWSRLEQVLLVAAEQLSKLRERSGVQAL